VTARRPLVGGNWKMHLVGNEAERYCRELVPLIAGTTAEVVIFPSAPYLGLVAAALAQDRAQEGAPTGASPATCGAQDVHAEPKGAFTGDVSAAQIADVGCAWVLCGHSERRRDHGEGDALVGRKAAAAAAAGLRPLICIGESLEERKAGRAFEVLERQLNAALAARPEPSAIAYEPIWAIGTGETATPEVAQQTHHHIREVLADLLGDEVAATKRVVYGGSVKPDNAAELLAQSDIDGFLVGGASLDVAGFSAIIGVCGSRD
jgi:triosephosphate isomerase (TIM)